MFSKLYIFIHILVHLCVFELPTLFAEEEEEKHELYKVGWLVRCKLQPNSYSCDNETLHSFYYDNKMQSCKTYQEGQCDLNFNSFATLRACSDTCRQAGREILTREDLDALTTDINCRLQPDFGTCNSYQPSWYFDVSTRSCKSFSYSGCGGNKNRFSSTVACISACSDIPPYERMKKSMA